MGEQQEEKQIERERRRTESQLQLVLVIDHDTLSWLLARLKNVIQAVEVRLM
jgi:hypothetical protein